MFDTHEPRGEVIPSVMLLLLVMILVMVVVMMVVFGQGGREW
jgi:hypothetical protein